MPLLSYIRKLVTGAEDASGAATEPEQPPASPSPAAQPSPPAEPGRVPPPPPASSSVRLAALNAPSSASLHTSASRPAISRAESSASVYRDFTGAGHADNGHWNDPPAAVFRSGGGGSNSGSTASRAEGFTVVDGATTPNGTMVAEEIEDVPETRAEQEHVVRRELAAALDAVEGTAAGRVLEDTRRRVDVLLGAEGVEGRLAEVDGRLLEQVCRLCVLMGAQRYAEALAAHREAVVLPGGDLELRWLVGVKRLVELRKQG